MNKNNKKINIMLKVLTEDNISHQCYSNKIILNKINKNKIMMKTMIQIKMKIKKIFCKN
jgi:hypothetical protein